MPVVVRLVAWSQNPYDLSVAAARTCYSGRGIVHPEEVSADEESRRLRDRIARSTLQAGHLTTRGHAFFTFAIEGISRAAIWSFLHSHPFYNTCQVSQRYVRVKEDNFYIPPLEGEALEIYRETLRLQMKGYEELIELLIPKAEEEYFKRFPSRSSDPSRWRRDIERKALEAARYILPIAALAYMYHTINGVTLHRYARLCEIFDTPEEIKELVEGMIGAVREIDPDFAAELPDPIPLEETPEFIAAQRIFGEGGKVGDERFAREFDERLGGRRSLLIDHSPRAQEILADSIRAVLGVSREGMSDEEAIERVMNPALNPLLADVLNPSYNDKLMRSMNHVHYVFMKKLSLSADSQDQRHRTVPASRPLLHRSYSGRPDYIVPKLIAAVPRAEELYRRGMEEVFDRINRLLEMGVHPQHALYLLPNGFPVRFFESGTLINLSHKWRMRLCLNAQEEIFSASVEELEQVRRVHPLIGRHIGPPCSIRFKAGVKPFCPEGERFCGVKVWETDILEVDRGLI